MTTVTSKSIRSEGQDNALYMQVGHNRIPGDVMLEIVSHLGPPLDYSFGLMPVIDPVRHRALRNLALTCREYQHHLLPFLFGTICVYRDLNPALEGPWHFFTRFCKSIVDEDERARTLATHVRTYVIINSPPSHMGSYQPSHMGSYQGRAFFTKALPLFPNLRELQVHGLLITDDFLSAAMSLPPLQTLRMEECSVPSPLDESLLKAFSTLQVTHLYDNNMYVNMDDGAAALAENKYIQELFRHYPMSKVKYLTSRGRTHFDFLNGLALSHSPLVHLEHVEFSVLETRSNEAYPDALSDFLKALPALKTLHIDEIEHIIDDPEEFDIASYATFATPPRTVEHLHAHLPALVAMIPGSSVSSIGIAREDIWPEMPMSVYDEKGPHFWRPYVEAFTQSRKPIVSMDVPMDLYTSIQFAKHFPALRSLTIRPKHWNWYNVHAYESYEWGMANEDLALDSGPDEIIALFLSAWDSHPELTELQFLYDRGELKLPVFYELGVSNMVKRAGPYELPETALKSLRQRIPSLKSVTFLNQQPPNWDGGQTYRFLVR